MQNKGGLKKETHIKQNLVLSVKYQQGPGQVIMSCVDHSIVFLMFGWLLRQNERTFDLKI